MTFLKTLKATLLLGILGVVIVAVTTFTGMATLEVNNTVIEMPFSYLIVGLIGCFLVLLISTSVWKFLWAIPEKYQQFLSKKRSQKALNLINQMMKETRLKFLATLGLIDIEKQNNKILKVQSLLKKALQLRHDSSWVINEILDNNIKCMLAGHVINIKDQKYSKLIDKKQWAHHVALYHAFAAQKAMELNNIVDTKTNLKKAIAEQENFTWVTINLAKIYRDEKSNNKAYKLINKSLSKIPHPDLLSLLAETAPCKTPTETYHHFCGDVLTKDNHDSCLFLSKLAANAQLWGESKKWAERALEKRPTPRGVQLLKTACTALHIAIDANILYPALKQDTAWHCIKCKTPHKDWQIQCRNCEGIDSIQY